MMTLFSNKCFFMMKSICLSLWLWNYIPVWFMPFALDMAYLKLFLFLVKLHLILHSFFYQLLVFKNALNSTYNPLPYTKLKFAMPWLAPESWRVIMPDAIYSLFFVWWLAAIFLNVKKVDISLTSLGWSLHFFLYTWHLGTYY